MAEGRVTVPETEQMAAAGAPARGRRGHAGQGARSQLYDRAAGLSDSTAATVTRAVSCTRNALRQMASVLTTRPEGTLPTTGEAAHRAYAYQIVRGAL